MNDVDYSISEQRNKLYSHKKLFSPKDAAAIMLNIDPMYLEYNKFPDVELLAKILIELAENNELKGGQYEYNQYDRWIDTISAKELEQWALSNEYHWVNYSSNNNAVHGIAELHQQLDQERSKAEELQTRIAELENQKQSEQERVVNYDEYSIYGHKSENLNILFQLAKEISEQCDPSDLHSYPEKKHYAEYLDRYFTKNQQLAEAFYKILTPENVKAKGKKPEGVDTFQGFIHKAKS